MQYNIDSKEEMFRKRFRPGTRVELVSSPAATSHNLSTGARGTVQGYDLNGSMMVRWDNGLDMPLIPGVDQFKQLNIDAKIQEAQAKRMANMASQAKQKNKTNQNTIGDDQEL